MACPLVGANPLSEPMLAYCQLDPWEHTSVKFQSKCTHFHSRKCVWKCHLPKWQPSCPGGDELMGLLRACILLLSYLTHRGLNKVVIVLQMAYVHAFSWKKCLVFLFKFQSSVFSGINHSMITLVAICEGNPSFWSILSTKGKWYKNLIIYQLLASLSFWIKSQWSVKWDGPSLMWHHVKAYISSMNVYLL